MPRKGHIAKRDVLPDPIYNSKVVTRTINAIMLDVKREQHKQFYIVLLTVSKIQQVKNHLKYLTRL